MFDLLTFQVSDKRVVTLGGYVVYGSLKAGAEQAAKKAEGVCSRSAVPWVAPPWGDPEGLP